MAVVNGTQFDDFIHRAGDGATGPGNEISTVTAAADTINAGAGNDLIFADDGNDVVNCFTGNDRAFGGNGNDTLDGGDGFDTMNGGAGIDRLLGGAGNDEFRMSQSSDISGLAETIDGGADLDSLIFEAAGNANLTLATISNVEQLFFVNGELTMTAAQLGGFSTIGGSFAFERIVISGAGTADLTGAVVGIEEIRASAANNRLVLTGVANGLVINTLDGLDTVDGGDGFDTIDGGTGNDSLLGGLGNDIVRGGAGNDAVAGGDGSDRIDGGTGLDNLSGGAGNDSIRVEFVADISGLAETIDGGADIDAIDFQAFGAAGAVNLSTVTIVGIEQLLGSGNDITLTAAQLGAFDALFGSFSTERLILAGAGIADLTGATIQSIEEIRGSAGNDQINLTAVANGQFVDGRAGNDRLTGGDGGDQLLGGDGNDIITGNAGNDTIRGQQGVDNLAGGIGNDVFQIIGVSDISGLAERVNGGNDIDRLDFQTFNAFGAVNLSTVIFTGVEEIAFSANDATLTAAQLSVFTGVFGSFATERIFLAAAGNADLSGSAVTSIEEFRGSAGNDTFNFTGVANGQFVNALAGLDSLAGSDGNDVLSGGDGNDTIGGAGGVDTIIGGFGVDVLTGGLGVDVFDFNDTLDTGLGAASDTIQDFVHGTDIVNLSDIDADSGTAGNQAFTFVANFTGVAGQLRYSAGSLFGDTDGNSVADFQIKFTGTPVVTASDIVL